MNVRDFIDVKVICEAGSLRKAAMILGVTQPTLSNRIAHLEDQLGALLFDRSRGQSQPTDLALFIARRAANMAVEASRLVEEAKRMSSGRSGIVRIGVAPGPSRVVFADVMVEISSCLPGVGFDLLCAPSRQLIDALTEQKLDLVVCPVPDRTVPGIASELLRTTDIIVVARPDHPFCTAPPATIPGLFEYPVALPIAEQSYLDILRRDFGIDPEHLPGRILCSDPAMLARIVRKSERLLGAAPSFYFTPELEAGLLQVVRTAVPFKHHLYLHWNQRAFPIPVVSVVQDAVRKAFAKG